MYASSPACEPFSTMGPGDVAESWLPLIVAGPETRARVTGNSDVADALIAIALGPNVSSRSPTNAIVWFFFVLNVRAGRCARVYLISVLLSFVQYSNATTSYSAPSSR